MRKEIDIPKALAIIAVVVLHFNAFLFSQTQNITRILIIDQLVRFSVPLFVALSGYLLTEKYLTAPLNLKDFYMRRVTKLIPLYVLWSIIISVALNQGLNLWTLLFGYADYHLYFVPMIFQLYLLFPLLFFLAGKQKYLLLIAGLAIQLAAFHYLAKYSDQDQYRLFVSWIYYFILGIFFAFGKPKASWWVLLSLTIFGFILTLNNAVDSLEKGVNLIIVTKTTRAVVMIYSTGIIALALNFSEKLHRLPLAAIGQNSYLIYLAHTLFLRPIFAWIDPKASQGDAVSILLLASAGVIFSLSSGVLKKLSPLKFFR